MTIKIVFSFPFIVSFIFIYILVIFGKERIWQKKNKVWLEHIIYEKRCVFSKLFKPRKTVGFPFLVVHRKCWLSTRLPFWLLASGPVTSWANQASHRIGPRERQDRSSSREPKSGIQRIGQSQARNLMTTTIDWDYKRPK